MSIIETKSRDLRLAHNPQLSAFEVKRQNLFRTPFFGIVVFGVVLIVAGLLLKREDWLIQGSVALVLAIAATGLGLALGLAGEYLLGIAFIFAAGSYPTAVLTEVFAWDFWPALLVGTAVGTVVGLVLSLVGLRVSNFYFGMIGFFMVLLVPSVVQMFAQWTNGTNGLVVLSTPSLFGKDFTMNGVFVLCTIALTLVLLFVNNIRNSPLGIQMRRMRDAPIVLASAAVPVWKIRYAAYFFTSLLAGLGGALYSHISGLLQPGLFDFNMTTVILAAVIVGGSRTLMGPSIGVIVLWIVPRVILDIQGWTDILYGAIVLVSVLLFRGGIVEYAYNLWAKTAKRRARARPSVEFESEGADRAATRSASEVVDLIMQFHILSGDRHLVAKGVVKRYGGVRALDFEDGDSVEVNSGEVHLLLGPNGSGKTSLLNAFGGQLRLDGGTVELDGASINNARVTTIAKAGIARSFQSPALPDEVTPAQLFATAISQLQPVGYIHWLLSDAKANRTRRQARGLALRLASVAGLGDVADDPCATLTSGQRRMVDVLQALISNSAIVLLDEPAAGLSDVERKNLSTMVRLFAERGLGFVVVEHDLELALAFADRVTVMADGRPIAEGKPDEILANETVKSVLIGTKS